MTAAIDLICRKMASSSFSHTTSWAMLRANQLKHAGTPDVQVLWESDRGLNKDWSEFDTVYVYQGIDFDPFHDYNLNVFDGPCERSAKFFERPIWPEHEHIKFISLDYPMPNYGYRCKRKLDRADATSKMSDYWRNVNWTKLQAKCDSITDWILDPGVTFVDRVPTFYEYQAKKVRHTEFPVKHLWNRLVVGDSHSHSAYVPESLILRKDGRTLRGILKKTIKAEVLEFGYDWNQLQELSCYWGSIDIRHHLCREADPIQATKTLIADYVAELRRTEKKIEIVCPLPIEDESRPLPSTGYYEGTPFFGTRAQRQEVLKVFIAEVGEAAAKYGWSVFKWPEIWYMMDGLEFMRLMEKPRSVHLGWCNYRWDLVTDRPNFAQRATVAPSLLEF